MWIQKLKIEFGLIEAVYEKWKKVIQLLLVCSGKDAGNPAKFKSQVRQSRYNHHRSGRHPLVTFHVMYSIDFSILILSAAFDYPYTKTIYNNLDKPSYSLGTRPNFVPATTFSLSVSGHSWKKRSREDRTKALRWCGKSTSLSNPEP
jgi:hypothetical protein